jgi:putative ABC transport system permease protein
MKTIIRNFLSVIRRYQLALYLNILGLSVAFAAFMVIMIQLHYDFSFDKCHKDYDKIFRVEFDFPSISTARLPLVARPLAERIIESSPHIVAGALTSPLAGMYGGGTYFHVETEGERNYFKDRLSIVTPEFFDVFTFDMVEGSTDVYIAPGNVFIPLSLARKVFGDEPAVGKQIVHDSWGSKTVLGVYRDFPANSSVENAMYFAMDTDENKDNWGNFSYSVFIRINDPSNAPLIVENFMRTFDFAAAFTFENVSLDLSGVEMHLTALPDIHFLTGLQYDFAPKANKQTLMILFAIAMIIIAIAAINYTNFSAALTPVRVKSINTQRVLGARRNTLRRALVAEAMIVSFLAYLVAVLLVDLFNNTPLTT